MMVDGFVEDMIVCWVFDGFVVLYGWWIWIEKWILVVVGFVGGSFDVVMVFWFVNV